MTETSQPAGAGSLVCPFVALAEDRNRRADAPDKGNRCYAEPAPRQRDLAYQADYCYSREFASCSVFLAWAARNAAEPAYVAEAAQKAWASGIAAPEDAPTGDDGASGRSSDANAQPSPDGGLFGPPEPGESGEGAGTGTFDWVSASAWADAPWDEEAEAEAEERAALEEREATERAALAAEDADDDERTEEATSGPKVPAALPMRRRKGRQRPIRTRGSGEWFYSDPLDHEPLVRRRQGLTPPILLGVLGLLVIALFVFLLPTIFSGSDDGSTAALPSSALNGTIRPVATRRPVVVATAGPTGEPSPTPPPRARFYRVKAGDSLTGIAQRLGVDPQHLQCLNGIRDKNVVVLGARYRIPPEGFTCWPGWRRGATPPPDHIAAQSFSE